MTDPATELARIERLHVPGGRLFLFYEPPSPSQSEQLAESLCAAAIRSGFRAALRRSATQRGAALFGVIVSMR